MFFLFLPVVLLAAHYYIARRWYTALSPRVPRLRRWHLVAGLMTPAGLMLLGFARSMLPLPIWLKQGLGYIFAYWMGAFIYLLLFTLVAELVLLVCRLFRDPKWRSGGFRLAVMAVAVVLALSTSVYGFVHACTIRTTRYTVDLNTAVDLSDLKLVLVSDLHLGAVGSERRLETVVEEINRQNPDVVCIAGDFFDSDFAAINDPERVAALWKSVKSTYGVYACPGNHDAGKTAPQMAGFWQQCGITLLNEAYTVIDNRLILGGRADASPIGRAQGQERGEMPAISLPANLPVVMMDHNPAHIDEYTDNADLILSGHTHQGQLFPAMWVTDLIYEVDYGYHRRENGLQVIVTSGAGSWGMPMRVGTDHEIVCIAFE